LNFKLLQTRIRAGSLVAFLLLCNLQGATAQADEEPSPEAEALAVLHQYDQPSDTASLLGYLKSLTPDPLREQTIADLITQLGNARFVIRQDAFKQLESIGPEAQSQLTAATKSSDAEVRLRANQLLLSIRSKVAIDKRASLSYAALHLLRHRRVASAVPIVLTLAAQNDVTQLLYDMASETVWASVNEAHAALLRQTLAESNLKGQAVAIVALEVAIGDEAVPIIEPYLTNEHEALRMAAARALVDRKPRLAALVLVHLLSSKNPEVYTQAQALLTGMFKQDLEPKEGQSIAEVWRAWADQHLRVAPVAKLHLARLNLRLGRGYLDETFAAAQADATTGYRRFTYESNKPTKATVSGGLLRLEGDHAEADQRLFITAQQLTARSEWPRVVEVSAELTGENAGSGGYHVGLSVGRLKALFHPAYPGGGFRMETVDDHEYLTPNANLGFTPTAHTMHSMTMKVTRTLTGAKVDVEVVQGSEPQTSFKKTYTFTVQQLGEYSRIGLERSGRSGGAAIFDRVSIRLKN